MELNEIVKDIFKSKVMAKFSHYVSGNLYYNVEALGGVYQFPIATVESVASTTYITNGKETFNLSSDLGTTAFNVEMKGSELNRWIKKAHEKGEFIKIS